jgi:hypothetical protein
VLNTPSPASPATRITRSVFGIIASLPGSVLVGEAR